MKTDTITLPHAIETEDLPPETGLYVVYTMPDEESIEADVWWLGQELLVFDWENQQWFNQDHSPYTGPSVYGYIGPIPSHRCT